MSVIPPTPLETRWLHSAWSRRLRERNPALEPSLCALWPHPRFRYPESPRVQDEAERTAEKIRELLVPRSLPPQTARFYADPSSALIDRARRRGLAPGYGLLLQPFSPSSFFEAARLTGASVRELPRDPEAWESLDLSGIDEAWLSNPSATDGFYYPDAWYTKLAARLARASRIHVVSEESSSVFCFNPEPPGSFRSLLADARVTILSSTWPCYQPLGPNLSWTLNLKGAEDPETWTAPGLEPERLTENISVLRAFLARYGASYAELTRRLLAIPQGLRLWGDGMKPLFERGYLRPLLWPESGLYIVLDATKLLKDRGLPNAEALAFELFENHGIALEAGESFEAPSCLRFSYAAPHGTLERLARGLCKAYV